MTPPSDSIEAQEATLRDLFGLDYGLIADEPARQALTALADRAREAEEGLEQAVQSMNELGGGLLEEADRAEAAEAEAKALREALREIQQFTASGDLVGKIARAALTAAESSDG